MDPYLDMNIIASYCLGNLNVEEQRMVEEEETKFMEIKC